MTKEIIFFTYGDSNDISTWSNVPYFFSTTLEKKGIKVHRVNIKEKESKWRSLYWNHFFKPIINFLYPNNMYNYMYSPFARRKAEKLIKKSVTKYSSADYCIFLTYEFYNKFNAIPTMIYADVTYEMELVGRRNIKPCWLDKCAMANEETAIKNSKMVVPLFQKHAEVLRNKGYGHIHNFSKYVINKAYDENLNPEEIIAKKKKSNKILFIGNKTTYYRGALLLIESFKQLKKLYPDLELHIVAMYKEDFNDLPKDVFCHGYLHKDNEDERKLYYDLLLNARIICNPTPKWAGISSIMEAMYFYTPFVIAPFDDFKAYFGEKLDCGYFNEDPIEPCLTANLKKMLECENYEQMAYNGHDHVKDYTWDNFVDWLLNEISEVDKK